MKLKEHKGQVRVVRMMGVKVWLGPKREFLSSLVIVLVVSCLTLFQIFYFEKGWLAFTVFGVYLFGLFNYCMLLLKDPGYLI